MKVLPGVYPDDRIIPALDQDEKRIACRNAILQGKELEKRFLNRPQGLDLFSDTFSSVRLDLIKEIREADIVHFHWMARTLNYETALRAIDDKPVIWTMHDMNPFTGGCHYSAGCTRFLKSCASGPALGSNVEDDLSRKVREIKSEVYRSLNIHVVALSRWLHDLARRSTLFGNFPIHHIPNSIPTDIYKPDSAEGTRRIFELKHQDRMKLFGTTQVANTRKVSIYLRERYIIWQ